MNKAIKTLVLSVLVFSALFLTVKASKADNCTTTDGQYGTTTCTPTDVTINKTVRNPITGDWVDNLLSGDAAYSPDSDVLYNLHIANTSNQSFDTVHIEDTMPDKIVSIAVVDSDTNKVKNVSFQDNKLKFDLANKFEANSSIDIQLKAKVKSVGVFDSSKSLFCGNENGLQNTADVWAQDRHDQDSASICVQTKVLGATTLPSAGPTDFLPLVPFIGSGLIGVSLLFKKGRKS
jgi:hypothetical protein